jgi:hypothetical protein
VRRLFALFLLAACRREFAAAVADAGVPAAVVQPPPQTVVEAKENDFQHPQQIPLRAIVRGKLSAPRDDDFFRVEPGVGKTLSLHVELAQADAVLEVLDRDRAREVRVHGKLIPGVLCRESCFVHVSGKGPQAYTLTVMAEELRADRELEPNDRFMDAQLILPGTALQGSFLSSEDQDWYRVALPAASGQFLRVQLVSAGRPELEIRGGPDAALLAAYRAANGEGLFVRDLSLALAVPKSAPDAALAGAGPQDAGLFEDSGAASAADADASAASEAAAVPDAAVPDAAVAAPDAAGVPVEPPAYFFVLKRGTEGPYTLSVSLEPGPADLEVEPNDDPQHATPLGPAASGYLSPRGDQDWYLVRVAAPSVLQAQVTGLAEDVELAAFDTPDGGKPRQLARAAEDGGTQVLPFVALPAGDNYLRVRMRSSDADDPGHLYKLSATVSPDDGSLDREPNDTPSSAQPVSLPVSLHGYLWPRRDVDFFRFHVPPDHAPVTIALTAPRGMELLLRLHELHGDRSEVIGSSTALSLVSVPLKEGDYAVEVSSPRKDASSTDAYELHVSP